MECGAAEMPPRHVLLLAAPLLLLLLLAPTAADDDVVVQLRHQRHQHAAAPKKRRSHGVRPPAPLTAPLEPIAKSNAGAPNLENKLLAYESVDAGNGAASENETATEPKRSAAGRKTFDVVTRFLRIVETQHLLGDNCTAGTDLNLGEGVVDRSVHSFSPFL